MNLLDLVRVREWWEAPWRGMPEFAQSRAPRFAQIDVQFRSKEDHRAFRRTIAAYGHFFGKASTGVKPFIIFSGEPHKRDRWIWVDGGAPVLPQYPIYIVSKGRAAKQLTAKQLTSRALQQMGVPHYVVVEEKERAWYEAYRYPFATLLVLDPKYQQQYETFDELGATKSKGPGPARNFAWEHAIAHGHAWHWVMDDNIQSFYRLGHNRKVLVRSGAIFRAMEVFCERYENVYMAGPAYEMFAPSRQKHPAFITNTRIYSCNLIRNDIPYRWRGRYNEDTDLSLRILKGGHCTVQFFAFLQNKLGTQRLTGGNTAEFYEPDKALDAAILARPEWAQVDVTKLRAGGTAAKSQMLYHMHPDVTRLCVRWGRPHHDVDYTPFERNTLQPTPGVVLPDGPNEFGMVQEPVMRRRRSAAPVSGRVPVRYDPGMPDAIRVHFNSQIDIEKFAEITGLRFENDGDMVFFPAAPTAGASATAELG